MAFKADEIIGFGARNNPGLLLVRNKSFGGTGSSYMEFWPNSQTNKRSGKDSKGSPENHIR